jgi:hypothetical protein
MPTIPSTAATSAISVAARQQIARGRQLIDQLHQKFRAALQVRDVGSQLVGDAKDETGGVFVGHDRGMLVEDG